VHVAEVEEKRDTLPASATEVAKSGKDWVGVNGTCGPEYIAKREIQAGEFVTLKDVAAKPRTHCGCGAELRVSGLGVMLCGDCCAAMRRNKHHRAPLDERITAAAPTPEPDRDPMSEWTAGATPSAEWP
jgi:hypothetical protein